MSDEEKKDILFQIDMQLYDEFNDKFCEMNDNLGTVYSHKDLDDLEKLEKETEIKLLRQAIEKQSKDIEELKEVKWYYEISRVPKDKIKAKIEEYREQIKELKDLNIFIYSEYEGAIKFGQSLLKEE